MDYSLKRINGIMQISIHWASKLDIYVVFRTECGEWKFILMAILDFLWVKNLSVFQKQKRDGQKQKTDGTF